MPRNKPLNVSIPEVPKAPEVSESNDSGAGFSFFKNGKNLIILILCLVVGGLLYVQFGYNLQGKNFISSKEAANLALNYINDNLLGGQIKASLAGEAKEENGLYKFELKIGEEQFPSYVTKDGKILFPQGISLEQNKQVSATSSQPTGGKDAETTIGDFLVSKDEVCLEQGKPIVYFFGSESCSHCKWERPIVQEIAKSFGGAISFHENVDSDKDGAVFAKYSTGGIPTLVLGCKYYRVGSGERAGEETEKGNLTSLICDLTQGQPNEICDGVK